MKIALFSNSYFPIIYGSTTSVENFRLGLEQLGHEVHLFTPRFWGYHYRLKNIQLYPSIMFGYKIKYPLAFYWSPRIHREVARGNFDIVHVQHPFAVGCDGMRIAKKNKIPLVFTHHAKYEDYTHYVPPFFPQQLLKKIVRYKVSRFANRCDICIAPSETIRGYMQERGIQAPIRVLSSGINCQRFQEGKRKETRKKLGIGDRQKILMFLGRIEEEKNISFLLKAIFPLLEKQKELKFLLVGEGSLVEKIKQQASQQNILKQLIFTGLVAPAEVPDFYAAADIFVHASLTETQGMTITEAMAAGLPIVAVKASGVVDQLEHRKTGIMVKEDPAAFRQELIALLADDKASVSLGEAARRKAKEFDNLIRTQQLLAIYQQAIELSRQ